MEQERNQLLDLRTKLEQGLNEQLEAVYINGHPERRLPHVTNMSFGFVEGESLMMGAKEIACSRGSACTSASLEPSYVLKALGVGDELAHSSLRLSLGRWTTQEEIDQTIAVLVKAVNHLRELSPLWDLYKEGVDLSTVEWQSH
jgi:cysteine desulfurase